MMQVTQYPITTPFGAVKGYPLNPIPAKPGFGFHMGIDYGCPTGTAVVVNGVPIGISGNTGASTGPHCHIGKWSGGTVMNPGVGQGLQFASAVVSDIGEDPTNGKYVKVQGDGYTWVYLHLSKNDIVKVGQVLQGELVMTPEQIADFTSKQHFVGYGRPASDATFKNWGDLLENNPIDGILTILTAIDGDPDALKNKATDGTVPTGTYLKVNKSDIVEVS